MGFLRNKPKQKLNRRLIIDLLDPNWTKLLLLQTILDD